MQEYFRLTFGMPPTNNDERCHCDARLTAGHALACVRTRQKCATPRHDIVVQAIYSLLNDGGGVRVQREYRPRPKNGVRQPRLRPDLLIDESILADVVITTPTCKSYVERGSDCQALKAATINENAKRTKYNQLASNERCDLFPLAFESYGAWGKFFNKMADLVTARSYGRMISRGQFLSHARRKVSIAIVVGNGSLVRNSLRLATRRDIRRVHLNAGRDGLGRVSVAI
jgi:hypothetical protein